MNFLSKNIALAILIFFVGCSEGQDKLSFNNEADTKEYILQFWSTFQQANLEKMKIFYSNEVILLSGDRLRYKSYGINPSGGKEKSKKYDINDIFYAYSNMKKSFGEKRWKYIFSNRNIESIEIDRVGEQRYYRYEAKKNDITLIVRTGDLNDRLIFVFSSKTGKIISQRIRIVFAGSHYLDGFKK